MMKLLKFLSQLRAENIELTLDGDRLRCKAPSGALTPEIRSQLAENKEELISFLKKNTVREETAPLETMEAPAPVPATPSPHLVREAISPGQQRLWLLEKLRPDNTASHHFLSFALHGVLDPLALEGVLQKLVDHCEVLRTSFLKLDYLPGQVIHQNVNLVLALLDFTDIDPESAPVLLRDIAVKESHRPFDLEKPPLLRLTMVRFKNDYHKLLLVIHRIIADAPSIELILKYVSTYYGQTEQNQKVDLLSTYPQFGSFVKLQQAYLHEGSYKASLEWWKEQLAGCCQSLDLPFDRPRPNVLTFSGEHVHFALNGQSYQTFETYCGNNRDPMAVLLSGFNVLLHRLSHQRDLLVGCYLNERSDPSFEKAIGPFRNWQILRSLVPGEKGLMTFEGLVEKTAELIVQAKAHSAVPFELLIEELELERDLSRNTLFQTTFSFREASTNSLSLKGCESAALNVGTIVSEYDLSLDIQRGTHGLKCTFVYNKNLFNHDSIIRMSENFCLLLQRLLETPNKNVLQVDLLDPDTRAMLLDVWNRTDLNFGEPTSLKELFERQVQIYPDNMALFYQGESVSYTELNARANQLAHYLTRLGVTSENAVVVYMTRSLQRVTGMLATLKLGAAYVAIDPDYPEEGRAYMLEDCGAKIILSQRNLYGTLGEGHETVYLDPHWELFSAESPKNLSGTVLPDQLAYILYTSGPNARHKGIQTTQAAVCNRLQWLQHCFAMEPGDRILQKTPFVYDISVWEIFWPLISGATLVLARHGTHRDPRIMVQQVAEERITHLHFIPSVLREFLKPDEVSTCTSLKKAFCSGEALPVDLQRKFFSRFPEAELHNLYGPPEVTLDATCWRVDELDRRHTFPIGKPIANVKVFVVDGHLKPVPIGVEGELMIGGKDLSRGYYNLPRLTAKRFIPDPYSGMSGARLFRSGDLVRFLGDGNLEFTGHLEHSKRMRGFRIDYAEIQTILEGHPKIACAQVVMRLDPAGQQILVAYIIPDEMDAPVEDDLRGMLRKILPNYMIPSVFMMVAAFPTTLGGKIDRNALPIPQKELAGEDEVYARAHSEIERVVLNAWREVLHLDKIDVNQNFFEIGGDSIGLIQIYHKLPALMTADLSVMDLFKHPTIHDLALFFEAKEEELAVSSRGQDHHEQVKRFMEQVKKDAEGMNIAIVGMAGRFPAANNPQEFWKNIMGGVFCLSTFSASELLDAGIDPEIVKDPNYVPVRGVLSEIKDFDADFFDFTPREAQITDPQHRIFLECCWEALENSGYVPQKYKRPIGIYGGVGYSEYFASHIAPNTQLWERVGAMPIMIGNSTDNFCTRVAFKLGLTGPALSVQTACSTGLVVVHLACQGLTNGDCEVALAGGTHFGALGKIGYLYEEGLTMPPDGICRAFDARGMGSTVSQGTAVVVLKRLENAIQDGDRIYAVVKGTAVNNDGLNKDGYTSYSVDGQADVIARAHRQANINPDTISYLETSSTGSPLGDPIEVEGMTRAFRLKTDRKKFCALGALKPNIGGLDVAAGTASLIKAALSIYHRKLPPLIHFEKPNPTIDFENSPFYINTRLRDWEFNGAQRRAGVSAFGLGGTNAHIVLEEGPRFEPSPQSRSWQIVTLSAKTATALETMTTNFCQYLEENPHENFADMCFTLHVGRHDFKHRRVLIAQNLHEAVLELKKKDSDRTYTANHKAGGRAVAFMFPGQGAQYLNMGRQLFREERVYRREVERCWAMVHKHFPEVYREMSPKDLVGRTHKVDRTVVTQPILFATEYALARLLMSWGIQPQAMIGNGLGEFVAACLAGVFSLEECIIAIVTRGLLMQEMPPGAQLAVKLPEAQVRELLNDRLSLAGIPNPNMCMISGEKDAILKLKHDLDAQNILCYRLHASRAFHSFMMDPVVPKFTEKLRELKLNPPTLPFISNVTGTWITDEQATSPEYWAQQLRSTVRFSQGLEVLYQEPSRILLEVGPEKILSGAAIHHPSKLRDQRVLATMRQPQEEESDLHHLLNTIGRLWLFGVEIDWDSYHNDKKRFRMPLPTYPFERVRHWIEKPKRSDYLPILEPDVLSAIADPEDSHYRPNVSTEFVAPKTDDEVYIAQIWCDFLGLREVGIHDDFFELGGSSLVAVRLVSLLSQKFNVPIASHMILKKRTIASLAQYVRQHVVSAEESDSPLVEINRGHPRSLPLFLVHPVGGEVFFYREMAQALGSEQAVYAFQTPSLVGKMEPFSDIRKQAAFYVQELLKFRPRSPYLLGGSSYGGVVAYEMAQQLVATGAQVPLVVMVDSPGPGAVPKRLTDFAEILNYLLGDELNININELRDLDPEEQLAYVFEEARFANRMDLLPASLGIPMFKTWMAHQEAMHNYRPDPYDGRLIFLRPTEQAKGNLMNMHLSWIDLVRGGIEIHQIPGNHITMNEQPNVAILANHIKTALRGLAGHNR